MQKPEVISNPTMRLVGRTNSIEEANLIAEQYENQGFQTQIVKKRVGSIPLYEVYAGKQPDIFVAETKL